MLTDRIIGRVGADILSRRLADARQGDGKVLDSAALFRLDKLSPAQNAAIVREILANPELSARVDLQIPSALVEGFDLPSFALTALNAGAVRNAGTDKEALLTANGNEHNLADTLGHVTALGAKELRSDESAWMEATCHVAGIAPTLDDRQVFKAALRGLIAATELSLIQLGEFCWKVSDAITVRGLPIRDAIGWALPFVGLPRDTSFFANSKTYNSSYTPWRKAFEMLLSNRAPFLSRLKVNGQPLDTEEMKARLEEHGNDIKDNVRPTLEAFINAPPGDEATAAEVAMLEWEMDGVHYLFDKPREKQQGLAESTLHFFDHDCKDPDVLIDQWRKHLEELKTRERRSDFPEEEDEVFFALHRRYIEEQPKLHSRWEKVIFGKPIECHDFLEGFVSVTHSLVVKAGECQGERFLRLTVNKGRKEWRERFNYDVGSYFSAMYRGLKELMGSKVDWRVEKMGTANLPDPLFRYPEFFAREYEIRKKNIKPQTSLARAAVQIKFEVSLIQRVDSKETVLEKTQLVWNYRPESIGLSLAEDMTRLQEKGGVACTEVPRRVVSKKGGVQSVSLLDTSTLEAIYSRDAGSLVPPASRLPSMRHDIKKRINDLAAEGRLTRDQRDELRTAWDAFEADYGQAIHDFIHTGLHGEAVLRQAESFGALLRALATHARGDVCRSRLVSEVLSIGTVRVSGDQPSLIIPPWHPERMKALAVKTRRVAGLVTHILNNNALFGDRGIFFREFSEELAHPFYPEIATIQRGGVPVLVSESSTVNGYSLLERPVRDDEDALTDVSPLVASKQVRELLERYVGLQPHEANNLSVLLYNADAAELPLSVVRELANLHAETDVQCNVSVRHRDSGKLRRVYAELVTKAGDDPDLPVVSETSENFISKLRISVIPASATPSQTKDGFRAFDVAFLHDVVSRTAGVEWIPVEWTNERPTLEHAPSRWSYRNVSGENELKSTTLLTCPRQTASGWAYVGAVASVVRQTDAPPGTCFLPARRISLQNEALKATLEDAHSLAEWVATYDELLDKRQLQANGVTVVRYRRASTNGRNMIVSSTSELRLLGVLARRRLGELGLPFTPEMLEDVAGRVKKDALSISGDIVLRAAKRGVSAGEMMGLVMSRYLLDHEFKRIVGSGTRQSFNVYFLLDDYADWLAQKESRIADILGLCVEEREDGLTLHIAVIESKYVTAAGAADAKRSSKAQLLATLSTFRAALFGDPGHLDRDVWLSRLSDLLIDADIPPGCTDLLERARTKLREGEANISLRGYSHVFIHSTDPTGGSSVSEQVLLDDADDIQAWQEVFDRHELRSLVEAYAGKDDPSAIRARLGPEEPWLSIMARPPAARIAWTAMMELLATNGEAQTLPSAGVGAAPLVEVVVSTQKMQATSLGIDTGEPCAPAAQEMAFIPQPSASSGTQLAQLIAMRASAQSSLVDEREAWAEETTKKLKSALNGYGLQAAVLGTRLTPNGCLIRLAGSDRLRIEDIEAKRTQLLTTHAINLVTVQPKPGEIVVTIASSKRQSVSLWDLWARRTLNRNAAGINTSFVLGLQEVNGALLYLNLGGEFGGLASHEPHSLVAGATGSGKSVLIQAILLDIAATNSKELAQIVLIDPKMGVDYSALEDLPHMREKIVTMRERATEVLSSLVEEMESRYRLFASVRARDLTTFNAKSTAEARLPMLFLVHDEFADWMLEDDYKSAVSAAVQRLGVKARAAGIHLIFAAQRPDKDVMPMQLRENLGNRLILKVASEATSKIALDRPGAELLLGKGHLAAKLNGEQGLVFAQAPFLSDQDIEVVVAAICADNN
ncbi:S-DNA-T family DNA segregation ATPase FtsK/SpoIIIE [Fluviicoccus keumensis]|uniref:S-DNA-T family DNA segregation ATPase FtsK/SpoIIIE n=1 Tax=Fluviicoccus keumensis TaxID=1435465 RepID=A0A4Q7ZB48_9GAMM|nr:FtsK/SpoIIIE domain-containing protein [Fluviicoccus keumensis]RZU47145.1 S-DNA-T family DNA segregation ATPase FtsK/SpoIIIE [Fluviicoccus keumensis]